MSYFEQVEEAVEFLRGRLDGLVPRMGIVLGSGLGAVAEAVAEPVIVPYGAIPHFPLSTVEGHSGRMVAGLLNGEPVIVMQGRVHFYEGYTPAQVTFPMRVLGRLGIKTVVLTNAAGGINSNYAVGATGAAVGPHQRAGIQPAGGAERGSLRGWGNDGPALL